MDSVKPQILKSLTRSRYPVAGVITTYLFILARLPAPSYLELWVDGGPLLAVRSIKIVATTLILVLAIIGLGSLGTINQREVSDKMRLTALVANLGSGFALLVIIGSFVSLIPKLGSLILALLLFFCTLIGVSRLIKSRPRYPLKVNRCPTICGKFELVIFGLISIILLSIFVQRSVALESFSDAVQIYLPFFESFETFGSSAAILEKPAFSSFIQARGLGTHLAATAIGGWTSAQVGSFLALVLIVVVVYWTVIDHANRIFDTKNSGSSILAGTGSIAVLFFYRSAELYSKTHIVTFGLLLVIAASLPIAIAIDSKNPDYYRFKSTLTFASIAVCVVYPLNFFAVILLVTLTVGGFCICRKKFLISQIARSVSWSALTTLFMFASNLYFVGVLSTEPVLRSVKVDSIFNRFSSDAIWKALYESQSLDSASSFIKEPFASQGLISRVSIANLTLLFSEKGYLFFIVGAFGFVVLVWDRLNAAIFALCLGLFVFAAIDFSVFKNLGGTARFVAVLFFVSGALILITKFARIESWHQQRPGESKILWPLSPLLVTIVASIFFAVMNHLIYQPSLNRLLLQGNLGILLFPIVMAFALVQVNSPTAASELTSETNCKGLGKAVLRKQLVFVLVVMGTVVFTAIGVYNIYPQRKLGGYLVIFFAFLILGLVFLRVWQTSPIRHRNSYRRLRDISTAWTVVIVLLGVLNFLPTYPGVKTESDGNWGNEIYFDFRGLTGSTGLMPDSSDVLGFHTKRDVLRCLELASMVPIMAKAFPVNGLFEFAICQGTPGLNHGQLVHHYDSVLAPHFDEIIDADIPQTIAIFQKLGINYLVVLKENCKRFLISQSEAFDAKNLDVYRRAGEGSDFMILDIRSTSQVSPLVLIEPFHKNLVEYSGCTK